MCKKKSIWILVTSTVAIIIYSVISIFPNMFVKKRIDPNKIRNFEIIAHRGGANIGIENTLSCIESGINAGADIIEIDIHLTNDGHIIVCHDETVDRTTNGIGKIKDMTLAELSQLRITDKDGNVTDEHLPTLAEVISLVDGRAKLLIEIKRTGNIYKGIEQKMIDEITAHEAFSWIIVQSFNDSVLENVYALSPGLRLEKLIIFKFYGLPFIFDGTFTLFSYKKYDHVSSFNLYYKSASRSWINRIHKRGKEVKIWTLDDPGNTPDLPVDGIITDNPDLWKKLFV